MMSTFKNKWVWITGASSGIGKALAIEFAKNGANLMLFARNQEKLSEVANTCINLGVKANSFVVDVSNEQEVKLACEKALQISTSVDYILLNAGLSQRDSVVNTSTGVLHKIMSVNFYGAVYFAKAVLPQMIKNRSGHFGVISSLAGKFGYYGRSGYCASKHALHGFFEALYFENYESGIYVTMICPGRIKTDISLKAVKGDGTSHSEMDKGQQEGVDVDVCAKKILSALKSKKKEVYIGKKEVLMIYFKKYLPFLFYRIMKKLDQ